LSGQSYIAPVSTEQVGIFNVTFEPGCRNNWHIHDADKGGGQILVCVVGRGYYQEWGREAAEMKPGDCINIPVGVKHWHGAVPDSYIIPLSCLYFYHISIHFYLSPFRLALLPIYYAVGSRSEAPVQGKGAFGGMNHSEVVANSVPCSYS